MKTYLIKFRDSKFKVKAMDEAEAVKKVSSFVNTRDAGMLSGLVNKAENLVAEGKRLVNKESSLSAETMKALGIIGLDMFLVGKEITDLVKKSTKI